MDPVALGLLLGMSTHQPLAHAPTWLHVPQGADLVLHSLVEVIGVLSRGGSESCIECSCDSSHGVAKMALDDCPSVGGDLGMEDDQDAFSGDINAFAKVSNVNMGIRVHIP